MDEVEKIQNYKLKSYESYVDQFITKEEYKAHVSRYNEKLEKAENLIQKRTREIEDIVNNKTAINLWIENFKQYQNIETLTRKVVVSLIKKIYVYENGKIPRFVRETGLDMATDVLTTWSLRLIDYNYQQAANAVVLMIALISWAGTVMIQKITGTGLADSLEK